MNKYLNKGVSTIGIIITMVIAGLLAGGIYFYFNLKIPKIEKLNEVATQEIVKNEAPTSSQSNPTAKVNSIATSTATSTTIQNETANWKTYRNDEYGYEIKYPVSWRLDNKSKDYISFLKSDSKGLETRMMMIMVQEASLEETVNEFKSDKYVTSIKKTVVSGAEAYKIQRAEEVSASVGTISSFISFAIFKEGRVFGVSFYSSAEFAELIDSIISTFKFL